MKKPTRAELLSAFEIFYYFFDNSDIVKVEINKDKTVTVHKTDNKKGNEGILYL